MQYTLVDKAPEKLKDNEMVILRPTFIEQISKSKLRRGVKKLTTANALRDALMLITDIYDNTVNPYRINLSAYEVLPYENDQDLSDIVLKILNDQGVDLITKAVDHQLKNRNLKVDTVFYVSNDLEGSGAFLANGFSLKSAPKEKKVTKNTETVV
jgi:hypothetical protein